MACKYCEIISGKEDAAKIYEDSRIIAFMADQPATVGHIIIAPKQHAAIFESVDEESLGHIFSAANRISIALFESIKSEGTNIIINNGIAAGQEEPHFSVNIIARNSQDKLGFEWPTRQLSEQEMATIELQLKEEIGKKEPSGGTTEEEQEIPEEQKEEKKEAEDKSKESGVEEQEEKAESYLIKQLRRMP